jgi:hypothetical protein
MLAARLLDPGEQRGEQPLLLLDLRADVLGQVPAQRLRTFLNASRSSASSRSSFVQVGQAITLTLSPPEATERGRDSPVERSGLSFGLGGDLREFRIRLI